VIGVNKRLKQMVYAIVTVIKKEIEMTFEDLYRKVSDLDLDGNYSPMLVAVSTEEGYKIVSDIVVETSCDGVGKFVLLKTK
jgi:hypothetical protein